MPIFNITDPDGNKYKITAPEGATEQQAFGVLQDKLQNEYASTAKGASTMGGILEGLPIVGPAVKAGGQYAAAGLRSLTSGKPYGEELEAVRKISSGVEKKYPERHLAGEIGGGIAGTSIIGAMAPAAMGIGARTLPQAVGQAAVGGGTIGAADVAARGGNPLVGGALGVVGGAAGPLIGAGIGRAVAPLVGTARGMINPAEEATRRVAGTLGHDLSSASPQLSPEQFVGARQAGMPVTTMDIGSEATRALARSAANLSPQARETLSQTINERFETQGSRIGDWFERRLNFANADATGRALEQISQTVNQRAYREAFARGSSGIWSPNLERLAGADSVARAMRSAAGKYRDDAIVSGYGAMNPQISFTSDGRIQFPRGPSGVPVYPDLKYWDLVHRELQDAAIRAGRGTNESRMLSNFDVNLKRELDRLVPAYQQARQGASLFFGAENALEAGRNAVTARMSNERMRSAVNGMSAMERRLFEDGYLTKLVSDIRKIPDRSNVVNRIVNSQGGRERLAIALGPQRAREAEAMLHVENVMDAARRAIQGNSTTVRQLVEIGLAGGAGEAESLVHGHLNPFNDPQAMMTSAMTYGALRGLRTGQAIAERNVANEIARLLVSDNPAAVVRGATLLSNNKTLLNGLRRTARLLAGATTQSVAPRVQGALAITVPRRAEAKEPVYGGPLE